MSKLFGTLLIALSISSIGFAKELTFEQFQKSCDNPSEFGHQNPPSKIRLLCNDIYKGWQPMESGFVKLGESRMVSSELFSDKHHVNADSDSISVPERNATCPRFREMVERASIEVNLTCADVAGKVGLIEICQARLDEAMAGNPDMVESEATGRTFSVCGDSTQKP